MRNFSFFVFVLLCVSACGGTSETVAPATTVAPTTTVAPATTVAPTTTNGEDSTEVLDNNSESGSQYGLWVDLPADSMTTGDWIDTDGDGIDDRWQIGPGEPDVRPEEQLKLEAACIFDESVPKISCQAVGVASGSQLRWESNIWGWNTGLLYEFELLQEYQLVPEVVVTLQECKGSDCIVISKTIDTSAIAKAQPQIENTNNETDDNAPVTPLTAADLVRFRWSGGNCQGEGSRNFEVAPIDPADIDWIKPLGHLTGVHVTPTSHQKIYPFAGRTVDVRAPISGRIIYLTNRGNANTGASFGGSSNQGYEVQYVIEVSCDFYLIIDHVLGVPDLIAQELGSSWDKSVNIPISAGDLLGQHTDGSKIDIGVIDLTRGVVPGLLLQESYFDGQDGEPFKFFERDSFEYFDEPLRSEIADKSIRIVEPRGGRFDYDTEGTARGNWFQEGTNGYRGTTSDNFGNYWSGHLALIEDSTEPSKLRVSVGDGFANAESAIWGVAGDGPRFETITTASGQTSYELRRLLPCDGSSLNQPGKAREFLCNQEAVGILLIELIDEWTLLVEIFFQSSNTYGVVFSENVRTYIR